MCSSCWKTARSPKSNDPRVIEAARLCKEQLDSALFDGDAHVILEDWNLEQEHVEPAANRDLPWAKALLGLSRKDRYAALALAEGYYRAEEVPNG